MKIAPYLGATFQVDYAGYITSKAITGLNNLLIWIGSLFGFMDYLLNFHRRRKKNGSSSIKAKRITKALPKSGILRL